MGEPTPLEVRFRRSNKRIELSADLKRNLYQCKHVCLRQYLKDDETKQNATQQPKSGQTAVRPWCYLLFLLTPRLCLSFSFMYKYVDPIFP